MRARDLTEGTAFLHEGERLTARKVEVRSDPFVGGDAVTITAEDAQGASRTLDPMPAHHRITEAPAADDAQGARTQQRHPAGGTASITENRMASPEENIAVAGVTWRPIGAGEIAAWLGVREQTVRAWRHRAVMPLPSWLIGGRPVWRSDRIETWARRTKRWPEEREEAETA